MFDIVAAVASELDGSAVLHQTVHGGMLAPWVDKTNFIPLLQKPEKNMAFCTIWGKRNAVTFLTVASRPEEIPPKSELFAKNLRATTLDDS